MKLNQPLTDEAREAQNQEQRSTNKDNHDFLMELADKIEAGEPLSEWETAWAAGAIRGKAQDLLKWEPKRPQGRAPKVPETELMSFYMRTNWQGFDADRNSKAEAVNEIARKYNLAPDTVRKALRAYDKNPRIKGAVNFFKGGIEDGTVKYYPKKTSGK